MRFNFIVTYHCNRHELLNHDIISIAACMNYTFSGESVMQIACPIYPTLKKESAMPQIKVKRNQSALKEIDEGDIDSILQHGAEWGSLDLTNINFSGDIPLFFADALAAQTTKPYTHIDTSGSKISCQGFESVTASVIELSGLESFVSRSNELTKEAGAILGRLLSSKGSLRLLDISSNNIGDMGVTALTTAFAVDLSPVLNNESMSVLSLSVLDLSNNHFGDSGVLGLCRGLAQLSKHAIAVKQTPALKVLRLNSNNICDKGAQCLAQVINRRGPPALPPPHSNSGPSSPASKSPSPSKFNSILKSSQSKHEHFNSNSINISSSSFSSSNSKAVGKPGQARSSPNLLLEELHLNDNPNLTAKGINALLGSAKDGLFTPLKKITVARAKPSPAILEVLAANIRVGACDVLHLLDVEFTEAAAVETIDTCSAKFGRLEASLLGNSLSGAMKKLADALLNLNHSCDVQLERLEIGALHRAVYERCVAAAIGVEHAHKLQGSSVSATGTFSGNVSSVGGGGAAGSSTAQYQETMRTLEAMNPISTFLGIPYIKNLQEWIRANNYHDTDHYTTPPADLGSPTAALLLGGGGEGKGDDDGYIYPEPPPPPESDSESDSQSSQQVMGGGGRGGSNVHHRVSFDTPNVESNGMIGQSMRAGGSPTNDLSASKSGFLANLAAELSTSAEEGIDPNEASNFMRISPVKPKLSQKANGQQRRPQRQPQQDGGRPQGKGPSKQMQPQPQPQRAALPESSNQTIAERNKLSRARAAAGTGGRSSEGKGSGGKGSGGAVGRSKSSDSAAPGEKIDHAADVLHERARDRDRESESAGSRHGYVGHEEGRPDPTGDSDGLKRPLRSSTDTIDIATAASASGSGSHDDFDGQDGRGSALSLTAPLSGNRGTQLESDDRQYYLKNLARSLTDAEGDFNALMEASRSFSTPLSCTPVAAADCDAKMTGSAGNGVGISPLGKGEGQQKQQQGTPDAFVPHEHHNMKNRSDQQVCHCLFLSGLVWSCFVLLCLSFLTNSLAHLFTNCIITH